MHDYYKEFRNDDRQMCFHKNTLLDLSCRYQGQYNRLKIDRFLLSVETFKNIKQITDEQALDELEFLLENHAYNWWRARRAAILSWQDAMLKMREEFSRCPQAHDTYFELFKHFENFDADKLANCVLEKYLLFGQLPISNQPDEVAKMDMLYSLLPNTTKAYLKRHDFINFEDLFEAIKNSQTSNTSSKIIEKEAIDMINCDSIQESCVNENTSAVNIDSNHELNLTQVLSIASTAKIQEPLIKVRRNSDLMPQTITKTTNDVKSEHHDKENIKNGEQTDFQIDNELMSQISHIIENCDMEISLQDESDVKNVPSISEDNLQPSMTIEINSDDASNATQLPSITENSDKSATANLQSNDDKPKKKRCALCRSKGHLSSECRRKNCLKVIMRKNRRMRNTDQTLNISSIPSNMVLNSFPISLENGCIVPLSSSLAAISVFPPLPPTLPPSKTSALPPPPPLPVDSMPAKSATPSTLQCSNSSNTYNNNINSLATFSIANNLASTISHNASISNKPKTAEIISPSPAKSQLSKLRGEAENKNSPKCHQCGTVGYYKSICPNCSPIYFYKPPTINHR